MPLVRHKQEQIIVDIDDAIIGGTVIKQKARFERLDYSQSAQGNYGNVQGTQEDLPAGDTVTLVLTILLFAKNEDGTYGKKIGGTQLFNDYTYNLIANGTTLVNAATGDYLGEAQIYHKSKSVSTENNIPLEQLLPDNLKGVDFMYENEFFRKLADLTEVAITPMIINKIQTANQLGRFNIPQ